MLTIESANDRAIRNNLVAANLAEAMNLLDAVRQACEIGARHAVEVGASQDALDGAREIHARALALLDFANGGRAYTDWLSGK